MQVTFCAFLFCVSIDLYAADMRQLHDDHDKNDQGEEQPIAWSHNVLGEPCYNKESTLLLTLEGMVTVQNNTKSRQLLQISAVNLCTKPFFKYDETGKQTVCFFRVWCSNHTCIEPGESKTITYFFLKEENISVHILTQLSLDYAISTDSSHDQFLTRKALLPLAIYKNSPHMNVVVKALEDDSLAVESHEYITCLYNHKKMMTPYLLDHIADCPQYGFHRDAIQALRNSLDDEYTPEIGSNDHRVAELKSPQPKPRNPWVDE